MYPAPTPQELAWLQEAARDRLLNEWAETHPELLSLPENEQVRLKTAIVREIQEHEWDWSHSNVEAAYCVDFQNRNAPAETAGKREDTDLQAMSLDQLRAHFEKQDAGRSRASYVQRYHSGV